MYIALKWLISLVLVMWLVLCFLDVYRKKNFTQQIDYDVQNPTKSTNNTTRYKVHKKSYVIERIKIPNDSHNNIYIQYFMLLASACMVAAYNRKNEIIRFTKRKIYNIIFDLIQRLKKTAKLRSSAIVRYEFILTQLLKSSSLENILLLLNKLKNMHQRRRNFSKLLINKNQEIKTMDIRHHLETKINSKNELNEFSKIQLKENRSTNTSFQLLYLATHQENISLKLRIKKLIKEKEDAERKLIKLISQVCRSKNNNLKVYCSQLIVDTENNLLNSDVKTEIDKFLRKCSDDVIETDQSYDQTTRHGNFGCLCIKSNEFIEKNIPVVRNTPKQCGEYVWTVKDKDGVIEKLYECAGDFDNGDTVKRIRQYSVYYDTECLLDFTNSTTFVNNQDTDVSNTRSKYSNFKLTVTNRKFLSSSQAFKNFLQNNNSVVKQGSRSSNSAYLVKPLSLLDVV